MEKSLSYFVVLYFILTNMMVWRAWHRELGRRTGFRAYICIEFNEDERFQDNPPLCPPNVSVLSRSRPAKGRVEAGNLKHAKRRR